MSEQEKKRRNQAKKISEMIKIFHGLHQAQAFTPLITLYGAF